MENMNIGKLVKKAQVNIETVRYYERRGLMPKPCSLTGGTSIASQG